MTSVRDPRSLRKPRRLLLRAATTVLIAWCAAWAFERVLDAAFPPPLDALATWPTSTQVLAADGSVMLVTLDDRGERRIPVPLEEMSRYLIDAVIAAEDRRFREHSGVDPAALLRAIAQNVSSGGVVSGASTLTMQLARILEPHPRSLRWKVVEAFRARQIERRMEKDAILGAYLNLAPLGGTLRGFEAAAWNWYGKSARHLDPTEAATLVALLPAPSRRAPTRDPDLLRDRRDRVLQRMAARGTLSEPLLAEALGQPITAARHGWPFVAPHLVSDLVQAARSTAERAAVAEGDAPYGSLERTIQTSIDPRMQARLEHALPAHGSVADGAAGVILGRIAPINDGDHEPRDCNSKEERDGKIVALVGAPDWERSKYNAARARRSVGSTLKPFLYALAMSDGAITAESAIQDAPLRFRDWEPVNFDRAYHGRTSARDSLGTSLNTTAIRLLNTVGIDRFRDLLLELGLPVPAEQLGLDAALGTLAASPMDLARAYARFADVDRVRLRNVRDDDRVAVLRMLADDRPLPGQKNDGKIAWKTGTSSGRRDAWCVAVTERQVIVVWVGNLDGSPVTGLVGARVAAPVVSRLL